MDLNARPTAKGSYMCCGHYYEVCLLRAAAQIGIWARRIRNAVARGELRNADAPTREIKSRPQPHEAKRVTQRTAHMSSRSTWLVTASLLIASTTAWPSSRITTGPLPVGTIAAIRVNDGGSGADRAVTIGLPLGEGTVGAGDELVAVTASGSTLPSQWNPLASWRSDGTVLHGALTFRLPAATGNTGTYFIRRGSAVSGTDISRTDIANSGFDAAVRVALADGVYELSAREMLSGAVAPRQDYAHFQGPLASEFVVGGPLRLGGSSTEHPTLQAYFYVRAFGRPVSSVYTTVVLENTGAFRSLSDISANSVDIRIGGSSIAGFPKTGMTVFSDIRYPKRAWWRGTGEVWVQHEGAYISSTKLMPTYRSVAMSEGTLAGYPQTSEWNERRILSQERLQSAGAKPELAPHDSWTAAYMVSGDKRAWNAMRAALDEYSMMVYSHSRGVVHARDEFTGHPLDLTRKGVVGRIWFGSGGTDVLSATRNARAVAEADIAHWPSIGYLPYLLTAESNELENIQHSAIAPWLNEAPGGNRGTIPGRPLRWLQIRGMAWALREIVNGAVVTPDHHPLRRALQTSATWAIEEYGRAAMAAAPSAVGAWLVGGYATEYNSGTGTAPWMDDFVTWAVGSAYQRGWKAELDASGFWAFKARGVVGRFGTTGTQDYCWSQAARYSLVVRDPVSPPFYRSWAEIYRANFPTATSCPAPGTVTMSSDDAPTAYGSQLSGGLSIAASTGIPGAAIAWSIYDQRRRSWGYGTRPEWAFSPSSVSGSSDGAEAPPPASVDAPPSAPTNVRFQ
jgi:hypothetical protein